MDPFYHHVTDFSRDGVHPSPEILRMSELNDSAELQKYSSAVLYVLSAVAPPADYIEVIADSFIDAIKSSGVRLSLLSQLWMFLANCSYPVMAYPSQCATHSHRFLL